MSPVMDASLSRRFKSDGIALAWDAWGPSAGADLVLVHGYTGSTHEFEPHIEALARRRRVLAIDHPGHGFSDHHEDPDQYRVSNLAVTCAAWLDAVADGPVDLLGHSMGGRVVLELTLARPDLVRSLVLMDTTAWSFAGSDPAASAPFASMLHLLEPGMDLGGHLLEGDEGALIEAAMSAAWLAHRDVVWRRLDPLAAREFGLELFGDRLVALGERLTEIAVPTTVVVGELDGEYAAVAPELVAGLPLSRLEVIEGAFHSPQITHPAQWRAAVERHLVWAEEVS